MITRLANQYRNFMAHKQPGAGRFPELSYANENDPAVKQWLVRAVESLSGRDHFADLYEIWRSEIVGNSPTPMGDMLKLLDIGLEAKGNWPPQNLPDGPLVMIANHPFGIGDGIAALAMAEQLGRPYKVIINAELLKIPEIRPFSLPIDFSETRQAQATNLATRKQALDLVKQGTIIVIFPAGGVATASHAFGRASDLPWKLFAAKLVSASGASVLPIHFAGQNSFLFHLASAISQTARMSLFVREFRRLVGQTIKARAGEIMLPKELSAFRDRQALTDHLHNAVFALAE